MPKPAADGLKAVVLVPYLPGSSDVSGPARTLRELLTVGSVDEAVSYSIADIFRPDWHVPGLCWETIDLGAIPEGRPDEVNLITDSYAAVAAAAVLHPNWMKLVDGREVPYPLLPDCKFEPYEMEPDFQVFVAPEGSNFTGWRLKLTPLFSMPQGLTNISIPKIVTA